MANITKVIVVTLYGDKNEDGCEGISFINEKCPFIELQPLGNPEQAGGTHHFGMYTFGWCARTLENDEKLELYKAFAEAPFDFKENAILFLDCDNEDTPTLIHHSEVKRLEVLESEKLAGKAGVLTNESVKQWQQLYILNTQK